MKPEFNIDDFGRIYCKSHPKYQLFNSLIKEYHNTEDKNLKTVKFYEIIRISKQVKSCEICDHYLQNDCYFSKRDFKKIKLKTKLRLYRCKLCGSAIEEVYSILHKKISESENNIKIPLLCRYCEINLRSDNVKKAFKSHSRSFMIMGVTTLIIGLIPLYCGFYIYLHAFEEFFAIFIFLIALTIVFFSWSIIFFIKILKLKFPPKKSGIIKDFFKNND